MAKSSTRRTTIDINGREAEAPVKQIRSVVSQKVCNFRQMTFCFALENFRFTTAFVRQTQEGVYQRKLLHLANCASVQQKVEQHE